MSTTKIGFPCRIEGDGNFFAQRLADISKHFSVVSFVGVDMEDAFAPAREVLSLISSEPDTNTDELSKTKLVTAVFEVNDDEVEAFQAKRAEHFLDSGYPKPSF